jgi:hypothetical protein
MVQQNIPNGCDTYVAGDSAVLEITVENQDETVRNISNYTAKFALAEYAGANTLVTKSTGDGITIVDGPNGRLDVTIDAGDTSELGDYDGEDYYYEVELTDVSGNVVTVVTGTWTIQADTAGQ